LTGQARGLCIYYYSAKSSAAAQDTLANQYSESIGEVMPDLMMP
jgi:hypothetical protein